MTYCLMIFIQNMVRNNTFRLDLLFDDIHSKHGKRDYLGIINLSVLLVDPFLSHLIYLCLNKIGDKRSMKRLQESRTHISTYQFVLPEK